MVTAQVIPTQAVPSSAIEWTQATEHAQFSDRLGHSTVVFDNSLWVIGGVTPQYNYFSDVWRSDDGVTWNQVTPHAAFGQRYGQGSVVFNDKIWVIAGREGGSMKFKNDVWYSADGNTWKQATANAPFAPRVDFATIVYNNKIWIIGGNANDGTPVNDVWYSADGNTWKQATANAGFSPRMEPSAVVYNGKIWVTGGFDWKGVFNDVWTSEDGGKWTRISPHAQFTPRRYQNIETADGKLWVIGGTDGKNLLNDVWYTTDGNGWTQAAGQSMFPPRYGFTTAFFNNRLWVIAGTSGNDVWHSEDILSPVPASAPATVINQSVNIIVSKTILPLSIKQGTDAKVTITVLNKGTEPVHDIEILDLPEAEFPVVDGVTRYSARLIEPNDAIILTYTVHAAKAGSFRLNRTAVMYAEPDGNYTITYSNYGNVRVISPLIAPEPEDPVDDLFHGLLAWINGLDPVV